MGSAYFQSGNPRRLRPSPCSKPGSLDLGAAAVMLRQSFSYKGVLFPAEADIYSPESISYAENHFQVLDDDIFNVTYPKSGSNWMLEILSLIREDGDVSWCHSMPSWERGPWVEASGSRDRLEDAKRPRIVSSHLPVQLFPKSFWGSKAKVIYTVRNPKDLLVSLQHYSKLVCFLKDPLSLDELLGAFLRGEVQFGSWFDHVKGWLELHGRENFFWISYEELKEDLPGSVGRICHFLGKDLAADALASVVENASFQTMRNNPMTNYSLAPPSLMDQSKGLFLRKGAVRMLSFERADRSFDPHFCAWMHSVGRALPEGLLSKDGCSVDGACQFQEPSWYQTVLMKGGI
ncbi:sulfotransferase 2B1-like isoform X3 [Carettochelys insculpta]|uniref:sulfotransferase 2B1-like isoform X3 n=1 Tax=Carettochelys insculpta TaxID=44489 RepID=UPI003EB6B6CA